MYRYCICEKSLEESYSNIMVLCKHLGGMGFHKPKDNYMTAMLVMITSLRKALPWVFDLILPILSPPFFLSLPPTFSAFYHWIVLIWHWTSSLLSLCFSISGGVKNSFRISTCSVSAVAPTVLTAWFYTHRARCPLRRLTWSPGRQHSSRHSSPIFSCPCSRTPPAHQGKEWLWLGMTWIICFILFLSRLGSCHCLAGTESSSSIPRNLCKKIDLSFHSRFAVQHSPDICFHSYAQK